MKIRIVYKNSQGELLQQVFENQSTIGIGRSNVNEVRFDAPEHRGVSGEHAKIRIVNQAVFVEDNNSTNGLLVNGQKVTRQALVGGETITLGGVGPSFQVEITGRPGQGAAVDAGAKTELVLESPPKKYGERTVGMMVQRALLQAGLLRQKGTSKSTDYFKALVESQVQRTRKRMRLAIIVLLALLVLLGGGIGIWVYLNRSVEVYQTTHVNYGDAVGSAIASTNRSAIFLLAGKAKETGQMQGYCTAFAISENVLATNAHCVRTAKQKYTDSLILMNGAPENRYTVSKMVAHPGYKDGRISPDVGLILIKGKLSQLVNTAAKKELSEITAGQPMYLYGFPGRLNRIDAPEATFIKGEIGRVTGFNQKSAHSGDNVLLQHSAFSAAGTSGSPMFNAKGNVIGINAGGYMEDGQILSGYNFGIRIDLAYSLMKQLSKKGR